MRRIDDWLEAHEGTLTRLLGIAALLGCLYIAGRSVTSLL